MSLHQIGAISPLRPIRGDESATVDGDTTRSTSVVWRSPAASPGLAMQGAEIDHLLPSPSMSPRRGMQGDVPGVHGSADGGERV